MPNGVEPADRPAGPGPLELAARVNLRLAQLDWPVVAEVELDEHGSELVQLRRISSDGSSQSPVPPMRVGPASLGRAAVVEAILEELRSRGWNLSGARPAPRSDALWCAPA